MNRLDKRLQQRAPGAHTRASTPSRWRIGHASVSTEELQAWQLGPARIDRWLQIPAQRVEA